MATYVPAKRATEFIFYIGLRSQADSTVLQSNPTIAAGDFKVSIDGGALANPATLPAVTPASSKMVKVTLSTSEMTGDNITLIGSDASGAEWMDILVNIQTTARQVDDLAFPTTSGRSLDVTATGAAGIDWGNVENPTTTVGLSGTTVKTATDVETDTADIQTRLPAALTAGGNMKADALALSGDTAAADNAESFFDGTGYAGTNNVIPTVTTVTTATNVTTVNGLAAGVITAASIAADAITDAKVAADVTIASVTGAVGSVTGNVGGNVAGSVASVTAGVTLAANAVTAAALAADAGTEIGAAVLAAAAADPISANVKEINDTAMTGTGVLGDEWGPA